MTKFCAVVSNIYGFSLLDLLHVTLLASRTFPSRFLGSFWSPGIELQNKEKKLLIKKKLRLYMLQPLVSLKMEFLDIMTLEAAEIMLPQNVCIQLSSDAVSDSRRIKFSALNSLCIHFQKIFVAVHVYLKKTKNYILQFLSLIWLISLP